ncbi:MAG: head-tail connector protein, partial [Phycisphaerales bacterium]|nr:head-tail connector protein [Phycisphaerales bacterium]
SVTSIAYVDADGNNQTLDSAQYRVDTVSEPGRIELDTAYTWPTTDDRLNAVTITIVAGYASAAAVPAEAKHLVKFVAAHWYEHRGPIDIDRDAKEMPLAVQSLKALLTVPEFH